MNSFLLKTLAATAAVFAITASAHADPFGNGGIFKKAGGSSIFRSDSITNKPHLPNLGGGGVFKPYTPKMPGPLAKLPKYPGSTLPSGGPGGGSGGHHHGGAGWVLGALTILASDYDGCGYEYYKWKSTGKGYWRDRYHECRDDE